MVIVMFNQTKKTVLNKKRAKQIFDIRNIALYIFALIVLAITWSGVKTVQSNYELQKKISELNQQNTVINLQNQNMKLQNKYLETDQYLELAARQNLGLAAPGEKVLIVPKNVTIKHVDQSLIETQKEESSKAVRDTRSRFAKNIEAWRDFLLGRKLSAE